MSKIALYRDQGLAGLVQTEQKTVQQALTLKAECCAAVRNWLDKEVSKLW